MVSETYQTKDFFFGGGQYLLIWDILYKCHYGMFISYKTAEFSLKDK